MADAAVVRGRVRLRNCDLRHALWTPCQAVVVTTTVALMLAFTVVVQAQEAPDADVKAAFLFSFMKFVEWPSGVLPGSGSIAACVMGNSAVAESLGRAVKDRPINGHQIAVSKVALDGPLRAAMCCTCPALTPD